MQWVKTKYIYHYQRLCESKNYRSWFNTKDTLRFWFQIFVLSFQLHGLSRAPKEFLKRNKIKNICQLSIATRSIIHELLKMQQSKYLYQVFGQKSVTQKVDNWLFGWNRPRSTFEIETTKSHFILQSLFRQEHCKSPRQTSVAGILYVPPSTHIFANLIVKI